MTLEEAVQRSVVASAYAKAPDVVGGYVYCYRGGALHTGGTAWEGNPATLKWRPVGGEKSWLPKED